MQDRYTGDIGDFGKLGLLRALQSSGLSIGVNWYLTPNETHNRDGRHIGYLDQEKFRACDEHLWLALGEIVKAGHREVRYLEDERILPAKFFSECLDFTGRRKAERHAFRREWHQRALATLVGSDIVFADPDNGLIVPSKVGEPKENKYVLRAELEDYYSQGSSVLYYQHKARYKDPFYVQQLSDLVHSEAFPDAECIALKFPRFQVRYFLFIVQPQHNETIQRTISGILSTAWGEHFTLL